MSMPGPELFALQHQSYAYAGKTVLEDISVSIRSGEKVALIGESGAGKSTLLRLFYAQHKAQVALCPQELGLVGELSVFHNIYMGRLDRFSRWYNLLNLIAPRPQPLQEIKALATQLGLDRQLRASTDSLSGGQRQRTALGRALYQQRAVFIGDEPVSSVDEFQAEALLSLITAQHQTVIVTLHDQALALKHFDRIIGLRSGRIVLDTPSRELSLDDLSPIYRPR